MTLKPYCHNFTRLIIFPVMSVSQSACVCFTFETFQLANSLLEKIETSADFMARENFQTKKKRFLFSDEKKNVFYFLF